MGESAVYEVEMPDGSWLEVKRIQKPEGAQWNWAFMQPRDQVRLRVRIESGDGAKEGERG